MEEEAIHDEACMADTRVSIKMPTGKIQNLLPPHKTQTEVLRCPFRKVFEQSQRVDINGIFDVGCFAPVHEAKVPKRRKIVAPRWNHTSFQEDDKGAAYRRNTG